MSEITTSPSADQPKTRRDWFGIISVLAILIFGGGGVWYYAADKTSNGDKTKSLLKQRVKEYQEQQQRERSS